MDRVASTAAQDVPSAEPGQYLHTGTVSPFGRQAIGSHLWVTFLCEQKSDSAGGSRKKRLTRLELAETRESDNVAIKASTPMRQARMSRRPA